VAVKLARRHQITTPATFSRNLPAGVRNFLVTVENSAETSAANRIMVNFTYKLKSADVTTDGTWSNVG